VTLPISNCRFSIGSWLKTNWQSPIHNRQSAGGRYRSRTVPLDVAWSDLCLPTIDLCHPRKSVALFDPIEWVATRSRTVPVAAASSSFQKKFSSASPDYCSSAARISPVISYSELAPLREVCRVEGSSRIRTVVITSRRRNDNSSPAFTMVAGFATLPLTETKPASQSCCATVRRRQRRLLFRNRSNLIGKLKNPG
jgi:hypothetical protein